MDDGKVAWAEALESEADSETVSEGHPPPSAATPRDTPPPPMDVSQYMLTRPSTPSTYTLTISQMSTLPRLLQSPTVPPSVPRKPTPLLASRTAVPPSTLHIPFPARPAPTNHPTTANTTHKLPVDPLTAPDPFQNHDSFIYIDYIMQEMKSTVINLSIH